MVRWISGCVPDPMQWFLWQNLFCFYCSAVWQSKDDKHPVLILDLVPWIPRFLQITWMCWWYCTRWDIQSSQFYTGELFRNLSTISRGIFLCCCFCLFFRLFTFCFKHWACTCWYPVLNDMTPSMYQFSGMLGAVISVMMSTPPSPWPPAPGLLEYTKLFQGSW